MSCTFRRNPTKVAIAYIAHPHPPKGREEKINVGDRAIKKKITILLKSFCTWEAISAYSAFQGVGYFQLDRIVKHYKMLTIGFEKILLFEKDTQHSRLLAHANMWYYWKTFFHIFANIKNICANMWQFMIVCISLCTKKGTSFYITFRKYVIEIYSIYVTASCFLEILWTCHRNQRFRLREKCFFVLKPPLLKAPIDCSFVGSFNWKIFVHKGAILTTDSQSRF